MTSLADLPDSVWTAVSAGEKEGIQYLTNCKIGGNQFPLMLDGGSGVNSIPEEMLVEILNQQRQGGIKLSDKRHPILQLERWTATEGLRGVAGGKVVPIVGAVVLAQEMTKLGDTTGPVIRVRYKICAAGSTDWVPLIMGGRSIDCVENGGLGFVPGPRSYVFAGLGIQMERTEAPCKPITGSVYAIRLSSMDSDDEESEEAQQPSGQPLVFEGTGLVLERGEAAWVPVRRAGNEAPLDCEPLD